MTDGYVNGRFTNYYPYFPDDKELQSDQRLTNISLKGIFNLPYEQKLSAGFDYRYDWLKAPMRVEGGKATDNTQAIYVQDEFALLDPLSDCRITTHQKPRLWHTTHPKDLCDAEVR